MLLLRGAQSDLVQRETAEQMRHAQPVSPRAAVMDQVPDCGHAPALNVASQLDPVTAFIETAATRAGPGALTTALPAQRRRNALARRAQRLRGASASACSEAAGPTSVRASSSWPGRRTPAPPAR